MQLTSPEIESLKKNIDEQIVANQGKNILTAEDNAFFRFVNNTLESAINISSIDKNTEKILIDYATDRSIEEFCRVNQYYSFDTKTKNLLKKIYATLFKELKSGKNATDLALAHFDRLRNWLLESNSFAEKMYAHAGTTVEAVPCFEYSSDLQLSVLQIDIKTLQAPVLDIGCGKNARLVHYLNAKGIEAYGIDRHNFEATYLSNIDWLEYDYGSEKWGTIVSNLGFSNHFIHHNLREDGNYIAYAQAYMSIIQSLKPGGKFHYAPDLEFIEQYLQPQQFQVDRFEIPGCAYKTTLITRLR
jgi:hypothetical protein